jgi:hypothetical protein
VCAFACGILAENKGRQWGGGFPLGLLLRPIALMLAAIGSADQHDIVRVVIAACRARCEVLHTPLVAHLIEAARRAAAQANPGHRKDHCRWEHDLRCGKSTQKMPV